MTSDGQHNRQTTPSARRSTLTQQARLVTDDRGTRIAFRVADIADPADRQRGPTVGLLVGRDVLRRAAAGGPSPRSRREHGAAALVADWSRTAAAPAGLRELVTGDRAGLIRHGAGVPTAALLAGIRQVCPDLRVCVLTARQPDADRLRRATRQLVELPPIPRGEDADPHECGHGWMAFRTFIGAADLEISKCDLVVLADATQVLHQHACYPLLAADRRFHLVGLLRSDRHLSPLEGSKIFAAFGPRIVDVPFPGHALRPTSVAWIPIHCPPLVDDPGIDFWRRAYWQHGLRSRLIARFARELAAQPRPHVGLAVDRADADPVATCTVTILVATPDHALGLADRLPGWSVLVEPALLSAARDNGLSARQQRLLRDRAALWASRHRIMTQSAAESAVTDPTDVLVWAGGGPCPPDLISAWRIAPAEAARPLLVVDCRDRFGDQIATWSQQRSRAYDAMDIFPVGVDPEVAQTRLYLATSPRSLRIGGST